MIFSRARRFKFMIPYYKSTKMIFCPALAIAYLSNYKCIALLQQKTTGTQDRCDSTSFAGVFLSKTFLSLSAIKFRLIPHRTRYDDPSGRFLSIVTSLLCLGQAPIDLQQHTNLFTSLLMCILQTTSTIAFSIRQLHTSPWTDKDVVKQKDAPWE